MSYNFLERVRVYRSACDDLERTAGTSGPASEFARGACTGFDLGASVDSTLNATLIASLKGEAAPTSIGAQVEAITAQRQRADASSQLMLLAGIGLTSALLEPNPGTDRMRLAMTAAERDALLERAKEVGTVTPTAGGTIYSQIATMLVSDFFSQPWPTR